MGKLPKEFLGAFKAGHRRSSKEFIDEEFSFRLLKKVNEGCEESKRILEYLTKFNNEFHKCVIRRGDASALHNGEKFVTEEFREELDHTNYSRRNDLYAIVRLFRPDGLEYEPWLGTEEYDENED